MQRYEIFTILVSNFKTALNKNNINLLKNVTTNCDFRLASSAFHIPGVIPDLHLVRCCYG